MTQDRFQAEVMDEFEQMWEEHLADIEPHKRPDYAEHMADMIDQARDQAKYEGM